MLKISAGSRHCEKVDLQEAAWRDAIPDAFAMILLDIAVCLYKNEGVLVD